MVIENCSKKSKITFISIENWKYPCFFYNKKMIVHFNNSSSALLNETNKISTKVFVYVHMKA